ncbi:MAG TPA: hypothetical protein VG755_18435 [Nannocystaceae bacterium]|nr:hypothetical protein [Nannocystaceae bacterium]
MLVAAAVAVSGCAIGTRSTTPMQLAPQQQRAVLDPIDLPGAMAQRTAFEGPAAAGSDASVRGGVGSGGDDEAMGGASSKPGPVEQDAGSDRQQRVRTGLFWAGVAVAVIGGATLLASGIGGRVTQAQLKKGYDDETLTHDDERKLHTRGDIFNALAGTGGGLLIVGGGVAAISFGVDYSRCGTLAKRKKRKDCK